MTRAAATIVRPYDPGRDSAALRACYVELQDALHAIEPSLPEGEAIVDAYLARIVERCATWNGAILVAVADDQVVGFVSVWTQVPPEPDESPHPYAFLSDIVVRPPFRRRGIGAELLAAAEARARAAGARTIKLDVLLGNAAARRLYERAGFGVRLLEMTKILP